MIDFVFRVSEEFMFQLIVAEFLFSMFYKKRKYFLLRSVVFISLSVFIYDFIATTVPSPDSLLLIDISIGGVFVATLLGLWWCFDCGFFEIIICGVGAFATQNFAYNIHRILMTYLNFELGSGVSVFFTLLSMGLVYSLAYLVFIRQLKNINIVEHNRMRIYINTFFILILTTFFSIHIPEQIETGKMLFFFYALVGDALVLLVQFGLLNESFLKYQKEITERILYEEQLRHKMSKENIELINIKCHDLKHQISALRTNENSEMKEEAIKEIEESIMFYDKTIKTGNETLDTLLMEKFLYCEKYNIKITCIADGAQLDFMNVFDIYSLFGNILDNAIESVSKEIDEKKRIISFNIRSKEKILTLHFENYFSGELEFDEGLPVSTKENAKFHGFGMMSIKHIVRKYSGNMIISNKNNLFVLNILIPLE